MADFDDLKDFERDAGPSKGGVVTEDKERSSADLLTMPAGSAAKKIIQLWTSQDDLMRPRLAQWKANRLRRKGIAGVTVVKDKDTKSVRVWMPPGPQIPSLNKAARLCRRMAAMLFTDPAVPEAMPSTDEDSDREAAEFATRALIDLGSEGQLDDTLQNRQAFDLASTYGSGFRRYWVDPKGGGSRPMEVTASPGIGSLVELNAEGPGPGPYVTRYVVADGTFTDDPRDPRIRKQWMPKLRAEVLTGKHVRFLPVTAKDIWDAQGVLVATMTTIGELKSAFPDVAKMDEDELKRLAGGRPEGVRDLLPLALRGNEHNETSRDDALVFVVRCYYRQSPRHPQGAYVVAAGDGVLLHRSPWRNPETSEALDLPVTQFAQFDDEDDAYKFGLMDLLGDGNEIRSAQIGTFLEHLDRFLNRRVFVPTHSTLQPKALQASTGTYIPINPGGEPTYEEIPPFPTAAEKMLEFVTADMDDESGLQQTAQGLAPASVQSGIHAQRIIEQALVAISDLRENTARALTRGWRITLQLVRAFYTVPQQIGWVGDDGEYKRRQWTGSDLGSARDVQIARGSFTSLTPSAKAAVAEAMAQMGIIDASQLKRIIIGGVGGHVGLKDDPGRMRVRRQITQWSAGPPERIKEFLAVQPEMARQAMVESVAQLFDPLPADDLPNVAPMRMEELARVMSSSRFQIHPPEWRNLLIQEFERARLAAGVMTAAEQREAQAQNAQAQEEAARQKTETDLQAEKMRADSKISIAEIESAAKLERGRMDIEAKTVPLELPQGVEL